MEWRREGGLEDPLENTGMRVASNRSFGGQDKNVPLCLLEARNLDPTPLGKEPWASSW